MTIRLDIQPRGLQAPDAARYLGMGLTKFRTLELPYRTHGGVRLYDRRDLDLFFDNLPYEDMDTKDGEECDDAFGIAS